MKYMVYQIFNFKPLGYILTPIAVKPVDIQTQLGLVINLIAIATFQSFIKLKGSKKVLIHLPI